MEGEVVAAKDETKADKAKAEHQGEVPEAPAKVEGGEQISAEQAVEYGLANKVVPEGEFQAAVDEWAQRLASKSPVLMRLGHDAMYRQQDMALDDALEFLRSQLSLTFSTEDIQEGVKAFFEKREPEWKGR